MRQDGTVSVRNNDGSSEHIKSVPDVPELSQVGPAKAAQLQQEQTVTGGQGVRAA